MSRKGSPNSLTFEEIKAIIPQRFPFLMLDHVTEIVPGERVVAVKNLSGNEWFYQGHFPQIAITPGAMILEAIAQAGIIFFHFCRQAKGSETYLLGSAKLRFISPVLPGSQLQVVITPVRITTRAGILSARGEVGGRVIAMAEITLAARNVANHNG